MDTIEKTKSGSASPVLQTANAVVGKAKESAEAMADQATEFASAAGKKADQIAASAAGKKADQIAATAGRGLESMAEGIRQHAPSDGIIGDASNQLVSTLQSSGRYLEEHGVTGMADDVTEIIRRNPIPAIFVALGVGFVLARATSARS